MEDKDQLSDWLMAQRDREDGFLVPDESYFTNLAERTISKGKGGRRRRLPRPWVSYASAAAAVLLTITFFLLRPATVSKPAYVSSEELIEELPTEVIDAYLSEMATELETDDLLTVLNN